MKLTFLGTGSSFGVPVVGCRCPTCTSEDPRDHRARHGALVSLESGRVLVDAPVELRLQLLREGVDRIDAVWITHTHADHVQGMDDLRIFSYRFSMDLPVYVPEDSTKELAGRFPHIFDMSVPAAEGTPRPEIRLEPFRSGAPVEILGWDFLPLPVPHGWMTVYGFRVGRLGYITDGKELPAETLVALKGVDVLVLNALWFGNPHPSHFNVEEAVEAAREVGARRTFLTHMTHNLRHADLLEQLPEGIEPAYDGLTVEIEEE